MRGATPPSLVTAPASGLDGALREGGERAGRAGRDARLLVDVGEVALRGRGGAP